MAGNAHFFVVQIKYADNHYYGSDDHIWALGLGSNTNDHCPKTSDGQLPDTYGMFDPWNPQGGGGVGLWKPYFFANWRGAWLVHENDYFSHKP